MYKIFINEIPVILKEGNKIDVVNVADDRNPVYYFTQRKEIDKALMLIENGTHLKSLTIYGEDAKQIRKILFADYKKIKAAGGVVFNQNGELLMIFRRQMWDLPKGKLDAGEKKKVAAMREITEETGVQKLRILKKLTKSYHTYLLENNVKVLKVTHWYLMMTDDKSPLIPQAEEGIEIVRWVNVDQLADKLNKTYANISEVIKTGVEVMQKG